MFEELTTLLALLKLHAIDFILAFFANSSDKSLWVVLTNVDFLRQMAFRGKMNYRFRKGAIDFLLVIHYHWCISRNYKVIQHFRTFSSWLVFPYWSSFGGF